MMKTINALVILAFCLGSVSAAYAQDEKNLVRDANAQVRQVSGFDGVEVSGAIDLYLSQGNEEAVAVSGNSDDVTSRIRAEVKKGILRIHFDSQGLSWSRRWGNSKMKAYVTFKTLKTIEASGACNVKLTGTLRQNDLQIEMSGASDFTGTLAVTNLRLDASGASRISASGRAEKTSIDASGASDIKSYALNTVLCKLSASGASVIRITVEKELSADASGGSSIFYKGPGLIRDISTSGGATVKRRTDD